MRLKCGIALIGIIIIVITFLTGCRTTVKTQSEISDSLWGKFTVIEERFSMGEGYFYTVYDNDTKVIYYYYLETYGSGMCPVYDSDGNVMIYEGDK